MEHVSTRKQMVDTLDDIIMTATPRIRCRARFLMRHLQLGSIELDTLEIEIEKLLNSDWSK